MYLKTLDLSTVLDYHKCVIRPTSFPGISARGNQLWNSLSAFSCSPLSLPALLPLRCLRTPDTRFPATSRRPPDFRFLSADLESARASRV